MVEKLDPVLAPGSPGTSETPGLLGPKDPQYIRIPWTTGIPRTSGPSDPLEPQDIRTLGKLPLPFRNSESKHPETLKLKHKQRTFLNYIIGQSKRKNAFPFWGYFIYRDFAYLAMIIRGQSPPLLPSSFVTVINSHDNQWSLALQHSCLYSLVVTCNLAYSHLYHW